MTWGNPEMLALVWLVPVLIGVLWLAARSRKRAVAALLGAGVRLQLLPPNLERRRSWRSLLVVLGVLGLAIAAARPQYGFEWREVETEGLEVIVALDLSRSMDAGDVEPSRLVRAQREIKDLLAELPGDRVGLVIFAKGAYPMVPLTVDHAALTTILDNLSTSTLMAQGTSLAQALRVSMELLEEREDADRALILISDGEAWDEDLDAAVTEVKAAGLRVYTIGVGTAEGAPIPMPQGGFHQHNGEVVVSALQPDALERIASATGGGYVRSSAGAGDVKAIAGDLRRALQLKTQDVKREQQFNERFQVPLAIGLAFLLFAGALRDPRLRMAAVVLLLARPAMGADLDTARHLLSQERPADALRVLDALVEESPNDPAVLQTLAEAQYAVGDYAEAADTFESIADRARDPGLRDRSRFNAGNAHYEAGRLDEAVEQWDTLLEDNPGHQRARTNRDAVSEEIAVRMQPPPPEEQQGEPEQGEDGEPPEGEDGEPQEGEPQEPDGEPGEGQEGEPQEGEPQEGEPSEEPQDGEQTGEPSSDGTREERPESGEGEPPEGGEPGDGEPPDTGMGEGSGEPELAEGVEPMSEQEAERLVDGVEEGAPRVRVGGRSGGKDW